MIPSYILWLAPVISLTGGFFYIRDTFRGKTKPNRVTWVLWAVIPIIATIAGLKEGAGLAVLPGLAAGVSPIVVVIGSFWNKEAYWKVGTLDIVCGVLSVLAIVLWVSTNNPLVAIALSIIADGLAAVPTLIKSWQHPETENPIGYTPIIINVSMAIAVLGPSHLTFANFGFSAYLFLMNISLIFAITRRRIFHTKRRLV